MSRLKDQKLNWFFCLFVFLPLSGRIFHFPFLKTFPNNVKAQQGDQIMKHCKYLHGRKLGEPCLILCKPACGHRTKFQTCALRHPGDRGAVRLSEVTPKLNKATNQVDEMTSKARASQLLRNQLENIIVKYNRRQTTH